MFSHGQSDSGAQSHRTIPRWYPAEFIIGLLSMSILGVKWDIPNTFEVIHRELNSEMYTPAQDNEWWADMVQRSWVLLLTLTSLPLTILESGSAFISHGIWYRIWLCVGVQTARILYPIVVHPSNTFCESIRNAAVYSFPRWIVSLHPSIKYFVRLWGFAFRYTKSKTNTGLNRVLNRQLLSL